MLAISAALLALFLVVETRVEAPSCRCRSSA